MRLYTYKGQITHYYITTEGKLYNSKTKNWLKGQIGKNGYLSYQISIDGIKKRLYAHRMVAETYLSKIENKNEVNHKDGNKLNNNINNLEWVNSQENKIHAIENHLRDNTLTKVYCFDKNKKLVCIYPSIVEFNQVTHWNTSWLNEQLNRKVKTLSHGYYWSKTPDNNFETKETNGIKKPIGQYTLNGELIERYESRNECARINGFDKKRLGECCNGKIKTYRGFIFKYLKDDIV